jgi:single-strand DNA-binding protein
MSNIRNSVRLIGHLGNDPEIKTFDNPDSTTGKFAKFSIATNDYYTNKKGERQESTEWHNLVVFGKQAEIVEKYLKKGSEIAIEGKLTTRSYEKDGEKRYTTEIVVNEFTMLGGKKAD